MATKQPDIIVCELTDRKKSSFVLEETLNTPEQKHLDAPSSYYMKTRSVMKVETEGGGFEYKVIRYINGVDIIDFNEQEKRGMKPNPNEDVIEFKNGNLTVVRTGRTIGLYEYLKNCEFNGANENKPESAEVKFTVLDRQKDSKKVLNVMFDEMEAMRAISSLGTKTKDGYMWEEEKIDYLCSLFGIFDAESYEEKVTKLSYMAKANPESFTKIISDKSSNIKVAVASAVEFSVISLGGDQASFTDNGKKFYTFKTKSREDRTQELVDYFLTKKGENDYKTMAMATNYAKEKSAAVA